MSYPVPAFMEGRYTRLRMGRARAAGVTLGLLAFGLLALGGLIGALLPLPANAHAMLLETAPQDGDRLAEAPSEIVLHFNETVRPIAIRLFDQSGQEIPTPDRIDATDRKLRLALPTPLPDGRYLVSYRVTSADSHPISGAFLFTVGTPPTGAMPIEAPTDAADEAVWQAAATLNRTVHFAALLTAAGGALFLLLVAPRIETTMRDRIGTGLVVAAVIGLATGVLGVGLQGGLLAGVPVSGIIGPLPWRTGGTTTAGSSAAAATAGLALLIVGLRMRRSVLGSSVMAAGAILAIGSIVTTGHAAATGPRWLAVPAWGLHSLTVAFWLGAFWPLLVVLREQPTRGKEGAALAVVQRFSRFAIPAVGVLVATGLVIAALQLRSVAALIGTGYGRLLLLKVGGVALLLLIAAHNRQRLTPALAAGDRAAPGRLRRAIRAEIGLAVLVLAATALLGQTPPPQVSGAQHDHGSHQGTARPHVESVVARTANLIAEVEVRPAVAGRNTLTLALTTADGRPLAPLEVAVALSRPEAGIEPILRTPIAIGSGRYRLSGSEFFLAGRWTIRIEVLVTDFDKAVLTTDLDIR